MEPTTILSGIFTLFAVPAVSGSIYAINKAGKIEQKQQDQEQDIKYVRERVDKMYELMLEMKNGKSHS